MTEHETGSRKDDNVESTLWDLRLETRAVPGRGMVCNHPEGSGFVEREPESRHAKIMKTGLGKTLPVGV